MTKNKIYRSLLLVLIIFSLMVLSVSSALAHHQLKIDLTVNKVGTVIPKEGVATVKGKVTCSQPAYVHLYGDLERRVGRVFIRGHFYTSFWCDGKTSWSVKVPGENGLFVAGKAKASVYSYGYTGYDWDSDEVNRTIRLKGEKPTKPYYSALVDAPKASSVALTFGLLSLGLIAGLVLVISPQGGWRKKNE
jgi:hypothetical protein